MSDDTPFDDLLRGLLAETPTLSLATVDDAGRPHAANVNFVADDVLNLYWLSSPDSAHSRHLADRPRVAVTAYAPFEQPAEIRGVQIHGHAAPIPDDAFERIWALFCRRFEYARHMEDRARAERFYRLTPGWARVIDNRVRFGFKREKAWPNSSY